MKLTRAIVLSLSFVAPTVTTVAFAEDKPAAEAPAAEGEKKAKKGKKGKKAEGGEEKKEAAPAPAPAK